MPSLSGFPLPLVLDQLCFSPLHLRPRPPTPCSRHTPRRIRRVSSCRAAFGTTVYLESSCPSSLPQSDCPISVLRVLPSALILPSLFLPLLLPRLKSERWRTLPTAACSRTCWHATSLVMRSSLPRPSPSQPSFSASASFATWNCCSMAAFLPWKVCLAYRAALSCRRGLDSLNYGDGGAKKIKLPRHHMPQLHQWWEESKQMQPAADPVSQFRFHE